VNSRFETFLIGPAPAPVTDLGLIASMTFRLAVYRRQFIHSLLKTFIRKTTESLTFEKQQIAWCNGKTVSLYVK